MVQERTYKKYFFTSKGKSKGEGMFSERTNFMGGHLKLVTFYFM
jgi:hypothetical protein